MKAHLRIISCSLLILGLMAIFTQASYAVNNIALVNAASYETTVVNGVTTGIVAPGSIAALFSAGMADGVNFAPAGVFPLPKTLGNAVVKINGLDASLMYAGATQINLQIPVAVTAGTATVEVYKSGVLVASGNVIVMDSAPGIFTFDTSGNGQSAVQNSVDYSINGDFDNYPGSRPEATGKYITIYATGIGKTSVDVADGTASPNNPLALAVGTTNVTIGGVAAQVSYSGLAPGYVGLWQINAILPDTLPTNMATTIKIDLKGRPSWSVKNPTIAVANKNEFSTISGSVLNAVTGNSLAGADLTLSSSGKNRNVKTDAQGNYSFYVLNGNYSLAAAANGYIGLTQSTTVNGNKSITLALTQPLTVAEQYRVVLSWGNSIDLDAHLTGPLSNGRFHIWWNGETDLQNTPTTAQFNRDATSGAGPETLTFTAPSGNYRFSVQNYTDRDFAGGRTLFAASEATVRVYKGSQQIAVLSAPGGGGTLWKVFEINNGQFSAINTLSDEADPSNIKISY